MILKIFIDFSIFFFYSLPIDLIIFPPFRIKFLLSFQSIQHPFLIFLFFPLLNTFSNFLLLNLNFLSLFFSAISNFLLFIVFSLVSPYILFSSFTFLTFLLIFPFIHCSNSSWHFPLSFPPLRCNKKKSIIKLKMLPSSHPIVKKNGILPLFKNEIFES